MFRCPEDVPQSKRTINVYLGDGGAGDLIASLVAVDYMLKNYPWINPLIWIPDYLLDFAKNVLPEHAIVRGHSEVKDKLDHKRLSVTTLWDKRTSPMKIHPVDYAFHVLCDEHVDYSKKNYLKLKLDQIDTSKFTLPEKYVVIGVSSAAKVKEIPATTVNEVSDYVIGKGYVPVYVGNGKPLDYGGSIPNHSYIVNADLTKGINLTNQTSLTEVGKIIAGAKAFVGLDGGLVHVAGCTDTTIVAGYTFIKWQHNLPIRSNQLGFDCYTIEPGPELGCRACQTNINFNYGFDSRKCYYDDYKCLDYMTGKAFIEQLEKVL